MLRRAHKAVAIASLVLASHAPRLSFAQSELDVAGARRLFAEAVKEEERHEYESALAKFKKVQSVKDTAGVRYRIATCLEGLGHLRDALASYRDAAQLAESDANQGEVARASHDKVADLERRLPALTLTLSASAPSDAAVELDDKPLARTELGTPLPVDVGPHHVKGHATGAAPFDTQITLPEGARFSLTIPLDPASAGSQGVGGPANGNAGQNGDAATRPADGKDANRRILGYSLLAGGGAFVVGAGITWAVRQGAISTIKDDCPANRCPTSKTDEVTSAKSRAQTMVPLTLIFGGVGLAALGVGAYVLTRPDDGSSASPTSPNAPSNAAPSPPSASWRAVPVIGLGTAGLSCEGSF